MRQIELHRKRKPCGVYALVDDEDFEWLSRFRWSLGAKGYAECWQGRDRNGGVPYRMHRMILEAKIGRALQPWPHEVCDHINRNGLDNRRANLRPACPSLNKTNCSTLARATSKYRGVSWCNRPPKWKVEIKYRGKGRHLGYFTDEKEAALAYDKAALELWGKDAALNFAPF